MQSWSTPQSKLLSKAISSGLLIISYLIFISSCGTAKKNSIWSSQDCALERLEYQEITDTVHRIKNGEFIGGVLSNSGLILSDKINIDSVKVYLNAGNKIFINQTTFRTVKVTQQFYEEYSTRRATLCQLIVVINTKNFSDDAKRRAENIYLDLVEMNSGLNKEKDISYNAPLVDLVYQSGLQNPSSKLTDSNSLRFDFYITAVGESPAKKLKDEVVMVIYNGDKKTLIETPGEGKELNLQNFTEFDFATNLKMYPVHREIGNYRLLSDTDSIYIYLKISYCDSQNKPQEPLRKFFIFKKSLLGKNMLNFYAQKAEQFIADLKVNNLW